MEKLKNGIRKILKSRALFLAIILLAELALLFYVVLFLTDQFVVLYVIMSILSLVTSIYLMHVNDNPNTRIAWLVPVMAVPFLGTTLYLIAGNRKVSKRLQASTVREIAETVALFKQDQQILKDLKQHDADAYRQFAYVYNNSRYPTYRNTQVTYFRTGDEAFEAMMEELEKAKKFVFMEYFIINTGYMLDQVLEVLARKVKEGVEVKILYDDFGCMNTLDADTLKRIRDLGIEILAFNRMKPALIAQMNNRDHRKITVIDSKVGFVGGLNLADEYINRKMRFGHWKDNALMLKGEAVFSLTMMFLQYFNYESNQHQDYAKYLVKYSLTEGNESYVLPFADAPTDEELTAYNVHLNLINQAKNYVYITTPYLIIDYTMLHALCLAAKNGVDVRIINPYIPDKWYAHLASQYNYGMLMEAGVRIYEYEPGFVHAKMFVSDDYIGLLGTINMDYRSYYMHHECGVLVCNDGCIADMKNDFLETQAKCREITPESYGKTNIFVRLLQALLNIFGPMM